MKLYISYWAQVRNFPTNLVGLNTTVWPPKWRPLGKDKRGIIVADCPPLKPGASCNGLCNGKCMPKHPQDCEFLKAYYKQLQAIDIKDFMNSLERMKNKIQEGEKLNNIQFALLVFETPTNSCSERVMLRRWLEDNGIEWAEWKKQA